MINKVSKKLLAIAEAADLRKIWIYHLGDPFHSLLRNCKFDLVVDWLILSSNTSWKKIFISKADLDIGL